MVPGGAHEGKIGRFGFAQLEGDVQSLLHRHGEVAAHGPGQAFVLPLLDAEHPGKACDFGEMPGPGSDDNDPPARPEHAGEFGRVARSKNNGDDVDASAHQGQRPPHVPHDVDGARIQAGSAPQGELGNVQADGSGGGTFEDRVEVVARARTGIQHDGPVTVQAWGRQLCKGVSQRRIVPGGKEVMAGRGHGGGVCLESSALPGEQIEVALLGGVETVAGRAPQCAARSGLDVQRVLADGAAQGGRGVGKHRDNPTADGVAGLPAGRGGVRLTSVKPDQVPLLNSVSAPTVHPDASRAVVSVTRPDFDADAYVGQLWSVPFDPSQQPRRVTRGFRDTAPAFSPDGRVLAFLRAEPDGKPQLHIVEAGGGEPQAITDQKLGVTEFSWAPDSVRIVFASRVPEEGRYGTVDGVGPGAEDARLVSSNQYRMNGVGYTLDKAAQLFVVDVPELGGEPAVPAAGRAAKDAKEQEGPGTKGIPAVVQLTSGEVDHTGAVFSSDGRSVYYLAAGHEGHDADIASGIYKVPAAGGEAVLVPSGAEPQSIHAVRESRNGRELFFTAQDLGADGLDFVARNTALYVVPAAGGEARVLSDVEQQDVSGTLEPAGPDGVLVLNSHRGSVELLKWTADGGSEVLLHGERAVLGAAAAGDVVAVAYADAASHGDVGVLERGELRLLSDFSARLRNESTVREPREFIAEGADGYPVHGWLVLPDGPGPHPVLLNIHGGPFAQYACAFFDEAQVYAEAGYAVLMCNPRGSAGYGQAHGAAIKEAMGTVDMADVLAFLDGALAAFPALDSGALGIMGGSYGGYLTAWTIAHDHRFKAAIVERGFLDPISFTGSSDIGWFFGGEYTGGTLEQMLAQSPMAVVSNVRTPTLVIHSENDLRCPVEQGQRYFAALKAQGVETSLLLFPGEDHELSRSGTPHHRKQRFEQILAWWAGKLPTPAR